VHWCVLGVTSTDVKPVHVALQANNWTPLHYAADAAHPKLCEALLLDGAAVDVQSVRVV